MRFSRVSLILVLLAVAGIGLYLVVVPRISATEVAVTEQVVWFSSDQSEGLRQDADGSLIASGEKLTFEKSPAKLFAAAYYPGDKALVTVNEVAEARLYEMVGEHLVLKQILPPLPSGAYVPGEKAKTIRPEKVRFTPIVGLLYETWYYPDPNRHSYIQVSYQHWERVTLGQRAQGWHAVTTEDPKILFLRTTYQVTAPKSLNLFTPGGKKTVVRLPDRLDEAMGGRPPAIRLEPVFVIPGRAIICKTKDGWSMHDLNGELIKYFPSAHLQNGGWHEPVYHKGRFYVYQSSKRDWYYRMDIASGKLVYVGSHLPQ